MSVGCRNTQRAWSDHVFFHECFTNLMMLQTIPVSKAQANQRAGRSGRECAGVHLILSLTRTYVYTHPRTQLKLFTLRVRLLAFGVLIDLNLTLFLGWG